MFTLAFIEDKMIAARLLVRDSTCGRTRLVVHRLPSILDQVRRLHT